MKIVVISDTHEQEEKVNLPDGDVLLHAGDITYRGNLDKLTKFAAWAAEQKFTHKIIIAGNHDRSFEDVRADQATSILRDHGLIYLQDSGIEIDSIKFWGAPWQPWFYDWAFNVPRGAEIAKKWALIPEDTNVLITHGPPHGILDLVENDWGEYEHKGCEELRKKVDTLQKNLKLHVFGHLHLKGCNQTFINDTIFVNGAMCDEDYKIRRTPIVVEIG
jgi:Icc-related predicted phosphoesterase